MAQVVTDFGEAFTRLTDSIAAQAKDNGTTISFEADITKPFECTTIPTSIALLERLGKIIAGSDQKGIILRLDSNALFLVLSTVMQFPFSPLWNKIVHHLMDTFVLYKEDKHALQALSPYVNEAELEKEVKKRRKAIFSQVLHRLRAILFDESKQTRVRRLAAEFIMRLCLNHSTAWLELMGDEKSDKFGRLFRYTKDYGLRLLLAGIVRHLCVQNFEMREIWDVSDENAMDFPVTHEIDATTMDRMLRVMNRMDAQQAFNGRSSSHIYHIAEINIKELKIHSARSNVFLVLDESLTFFMPDVENENAIFCYYETPLTHEILAEDVKASGKTDTLRVLWQNDKGHIFDRGKKHAIVEDIRLRFANPDSCNDFKRRLFERRDQLDSDTAETQALQEPATQHRKSQQIGIAIIDLDDEGDEAAELSTVTAGKSHNPQEVLEEPSHSDDMSSDRIVRDVGVSGDVFEPQRMPSQPKLKKQKGIRQHFGFMKEKKSTPEQAMPIVAPDETPFALSEDEQHQTVVEQSSPLKELGKCGPENFATKGAKAPRRTQQLNTSLVTLTQPLGSASDQDYASFQDIASGVPRHPQYSVPSLPSKADHTAATRRWRPETRSKAAPLLVSGVVNTAVPANPSSKATQEMAKTLIKAKAGTTSKVKDLNSVQQIDLTQEASPPRVRRKIRKAGTQRPKSAARENSGESTRRQLIKPAATKSKKYNGSLNLNVSRSKDLSVPGAKSRDQETNWELNLSEDDVDAGYVEDNNSKKSKAAKEKKTSNTRTSIKQKPTSRSKAIAKTAVNDATKVKADQLSHPLAPKAAPARRSTRATAENLIESVEPDNDISKAGEEQLSTSEPEEETSEDNPRPRERLQTLKALREYIASKSHANEQDAAALDHETRDTLFTTTIQQFSESPAEEMRAVEVSSSELREEQLEEQAHTAIGTLATRSRGEEPDDESAAHIVEAVAQDSYSKDDHITRHVEADRSFGSKLNDFAAITPQTVREQVTQPRRPPFGNVKTFVVNVDAAKTALPVKTTGVMSTSKTKSVPTHTQGKTAKSSLVSQALTKPSAQHDDMLIDNTEAVVDAGIHTMADKMQSGHTSLLPSGHFQDKQTEQYAPSTSTTRQHMISHGQHSAGSGRSPTTLKFNTGDNGHVSNPVMKLAKQQPDLGTDRHEHNDAVTAKTLVAAGNTTRHDDGTACAERQSEVVPHPVVDDPSVAETVTEPAGSPANVLQGTATKPMQTSSTRVDLSQSRNSTGTTAPVKTSKDGTRRKSAPVKQQDVSVSKTPVSKPVPEAVVLTRLNYEEHHREQISKKVQMIHWEASGPQNQGSPRKFQGRMHTTRTVSMRSNRIPAAQNVTQVAMGMPDQGQDEAGDGNECTGIDVNDVPRVPDVGNSHIVTVKDQQEQDQSGCIVPFDEAAVHANASGADAAEEAQRWSNKMARLDRDYGTINNVTMTVAVNDIVEPSNIGLSSTPAAAEKVRTEPYCRSPDLPPHDAPARIRVTSPTAVEHTRRLEATSANLCMNQIDAGEDEDGTSNHTDDVSEMSRVEHEDSITVNDGIQREQDRTSSSVPSVEAPAEPHSMNANAPAVNYIAPGQEHKKQSAASMASTQTKTASADDVQVLAQPFVHSTASEYQLSSSSDSGLESTASESSSDDESDLRDSIIDKSVFIAPVHRDTRQKRPRTAHIDLEDQPQAEKYRVTQHQPEKKRKMAQVLLQRPQFPDTISQHVQSRYPQASTSISFSKAYRDSHLHSSIPTQPTYTSVIGATDPVEAPAPAPILSQNAQQYPKVSAFQVRPTSHSLPQQVTTSNNNSYNERSVMPPPTKPLSSVQRKPLAEKAQVTAHAESQKGTRTNTTDIDAPLKIRRVRHSTDAWPTKFQELEPLPNTSLPYPDQFFGAASPMSESDLSSASDMQEMAHSNSDTGDTTLVEGSLFVLNNGPRSPSLSSTSRSDRSLSLAPDMERSLLARSVRDAGRDGATTLQRNLQQTIVRITNNIMIRLQIEETVARDLVQQYDDGCTKALQGLRKSVKQRVGHKAEQLASSLTQLQGETGQAKDALVVSADHNNDTRGLLQGNRLHVRQTGFDALLGGVQC